MVRRYRFYYWRVGRISEMLHSDILLTFAECVLCMRAVQVVAPDVRYKFAILDEVRRGA